MGNTSNRFHNELVRPATESLLQVKRGERVLDIVCGNWSFSRRLCELGARVVAFDYSSEMIAAAQNRSAGLDITYYTLDATDEEGLLQFGMETFDGVVSNMALMDNSELAPLTRSIYRLLVSGGRVVVSLQHPCFQSPGLIKVTETEEMGDRIVTRNLIKLSRYKDPESYEGLALADQPVPQLYFHRPLKLIMNAFFDSEFVFDGMKEPVFQPIDDQPSEWTKFPPVVVLRFRKV